MAVKLIQAIFESPGVAFSVLVIGRKRILLKSLSDSNQ